MEFTHLLFNINIFVWFLPLARQYKNGFFSYFLILAFTDPVMRLQLDILKLYPRYVYLGASFLGVLSILYYRGILKLRFVIPLLIITAVLYYNTVTAGLGIFLLHTAVFYNLLHIIMKEAFDSGKLNVYLIMLLLYELTIIIKISAFMLDLDNGFYFYHLFTAFDILVAIYFIFYNRLNSPRIKMVMSSF